MIQQTFNQALTGAAFLLRLGKNSKEGTEQRKSVQFTGKAREKARSAMENYTMQKEEQKGFRDALKGRAQKDFDALVGIGVNPGIAEKAIASDMAKGVYNDG